MKKHRASIRFVCLSVVLCILAGCAPKHPYYSFEGSMESRVVVIHFKDGKTEKIPVGTGIGGGLTAEHKAILSTGKEAIVEKGKARVTVSGKGPIVMVKEVTYDGKRVGYHEPAL
jgi:hypothetical protein